MGELALIETLVKCGADVRAILSSIFDVV